MVTISRFNVKEYIIYGLNNGLLFYADLKELQVFNFFQKSTWKNMLIVYNLCMLGKCIKYKKKVQNIIV